MKLNGTEIIAGWLMGIGALEAGRLYTWLKVSGDNRIRPSDATSPTEIEAITPARVVRFQNSTMMIAGRLAEAAMVKAQPTR